MSLLEVEGKALPQKDIWNHPTSLDVQEPHSPCFCPKIGQIDIEPEKKCYGVKIKVEKQPSLAAVSLGNQLYLSSIMRNGEICAG